MTISARVLFCGVGGSTEGAVRAGLDVRDALDGWDVAVERHRRWHPTIAAVVGRCEDAATLLPEPVDLVWASPSCRPWSTANRSQRRGLDHPEYYPLALLVAQAFDTWRARWLVVENVGGLVWSCEGKEEMRRLADAVRARPGLTWTVTVVRSCEHGVRQLRRRTIVVVGPALVPILAGMESAPDAVQAIMANRDGMNGSDRTRGRAVRTHASGHESHSRTRLHATAVVASYGGASGDRRPVTGTIRSTRGGGIDSDAYAKRGIAHHDQRTGEPVYHEGRTLEECAELQQIPMRVLEGLTNTAAHRLVGNAVPPSLAEWVCRCVIAVDVRERAA